MAGSNHKSVLVDTKRNRIGFCTSNYYRANSQATAYQVYCYTEKGFKKIATLTPPGLNMETTRGLYIGDYLYLADGQGVYGIVIYDAGSMKKVGKVVF